jgi:uncharacterized protein YjiS (DUF1127 family)
MGSVCAEAGQRLESGQLSGSTRAVVWKVLALLRTWRERRRVRRQLAAMSERELQDTRTCWSKIAEEAGKPFWWARRKSAFAHPTAY